MHTTFDSPPSAVAVLDKIRHGLVETADLAQIKDFRDQAEAVRQYAVTAALGLEIQNQAAETRLVAERRAGEVLLDMQIHGGDRRSSYRDDTRLEALGISQEESSRWQREASLPEAEFQQYLQLTKETGKRLTSRQLLHLAHIYAQEKVVAGESLFQRVAGGLRKLARQRARFGCIYMNPPWPEGRASKVNVCGVVQDLLDLPVESVAAERAHLHLWTPPEMLENGLRLIRAWGFSYRASLVRTKPAADRGKYWWQAHEILLLGVRGEVAFPDSSLRSWLDPRTDSAAESLRKIRCLIERASPGPYLELFGGKATRVWKVLTP